MECPILARHLHQMPVRAVPVISDFQRVHRFRFRCRDCTGSLRDLTRSSRRSGLNKSHPFWNERLVDGLLDCDHRRCFACLSARYCGARNRYRPFPHAALDALDNTILDVSISHGSPYTMIKLASKKRPSAGYALRPPSKPSNWVPGHPARFHKSSNRGLFLSSPVIRFPCASCKGGA